jgi:REP element-mobilizing transposase RayT
MSEYRKTYEGGLFFLTFSVVGWLDVFTRSEYSDILTKNLNYSTRHKSLKLFAYVIMPSHMHLVVRRTEGKMGDWLRDYKSYCAKEIISAIQDNPQESRKETLLYMFRYFAKVQKQNKEFMFWQKTSYPVDITSAAIRKQKVDYIHQNPVRAGYVDEPQHWRYSSAYPLQEVKLSEI